MSDRPIQGKGKKMKKKSIACVLGLWTALYLGPTCTGQAADDGGCGRSTCPLSGVEEILSKLQTTVQSLKDYQGQIEYIEEQPLLETKILRRGKLSYVRMKTRSYLRVDFETLKQDDLKEQPYREQFIFDGVWLTHVNYQVKSIQKRQLAETGKPVDAFDLARGNMPIIGFSTTEDLTKGFDIELVEPGAASEEGRIQLHLKVKSGSAYEEDYQAIDFWIDKALNLPVRVDAVTTEEDIYRIRFLKSRVNQGIASSAFELELPAGFGAPEIIPLDANR